ncbi:23069_t:CDS:1, partial [Dentiscutata erythropus]
NSITNLNENSGVIMSVIHTSINNIEDINKHDNSGNHNNEPDFGSVSGYQSINAVLREAFLRRHGL